MGTEYVDDFDVDLDIDTTKLDAFGSFITEVKMDGQVPSSNIVYDCSHGEWLLAQMAYDRKIRHFSCRSVKQLGAMSDILPEDSRFIFTGALVEKQLKRLVKTRGLGGVVVKDPAGPERLMQTIKEEQDRLTSKTLSRVSSSRQRFLVERRKDRKAQPEAGPGASVSSNLELYLSLEDGLEAGQMASTIRNIKEGYPNFTVAGLWGGAVDEKVCLELLESLQEEMSMPQLQVILHHRGSSLKWYSGLDTARRRSVIWTFEYSL